MRLPWAPRCRWPATRPQTARGSSCPGSRHPPAPRGAQGGERAHGAVAAASRSLRCVAHQSRLHAVMHRRLTDTIFAASRSASLSGISWCFSSMRVRDRRPDSWQVGDLGLEGGRSCGAGKGRTCLARGGDGPATAAAAAQPEHGAAPRPPPRHTVTQQGQYFGFLAVPQPHLAAVPQAPRSAHGACCCTCVQIGCPRLWMEA